MVFHETHRVYNWLWFLCGGCGLLVLICIEWLICFVLFLLLLKLVLINYFGWWRFRRRFSHTLFSFVERVFLTIC